MKRLLIYVLFFSLIACNNDSENLGNSKLILNIDNETIISNEKQTTFLIDTNCNYLIGLIDCISNNKKFRLQFKLTKNGKIESFQIIDYKKDYETFAAADFNATSTFKIKNFIYNNTIISFDFEGDLYRKYSSTETKSIKGSVYFDKVDQMQCNYLPFSFTSTINDKSFFATNQIYEQFGNEFTYSFTSDEDYLIRFYSKNKIQNILQGSYNFDKNSEFRVEVYKYIGVLKASPSKNINLQDWENYNCEGTINITEQKSPPGSNVVGNFTLKAKNPDGTIAFDVIASEIKFERFE